ncbi:hypothetical protein V6N12_012879 [Hibiscus sabdariffa]|uniref:DUF4283 domain-containing protein n=1 Tax=Hibiscus sabdariffa TaxID=183260 RepID=A0ABR2EFQ5_9ROSI
MIFSSRGPWTFKDDWLVLAAFNPNFSIDEYIFSSMNIWVRIYGVPLILMDDDNIAHHTGDSLGAMIGKVIKTDTCWINLNMVDYLPIGIVLDVTKPVHRCVAIRGTGPSPKLCPLKYKRLPTLYHGCGIIGNSLEFCSIFKLTNSSKLQYDDWIRYIPPRKQEVNLRSKCRIRYLDGAGISIPKTTTNANFNLAILILHYIFLSSILILFPISKGKDLNIPQQPDAVKEQETGNYLMLSINPTLWYPLLNPI